MKQKEPAESSDQELLDQAKQKKSTALMNSFLIGLVVGIIIYGVVKNNFGFIALIPLFLVFKVLNKPKKDKASEQQSKDRSLK